MTTPRPEVDVRYFEAYGGDWAAAYQAGTAAGHALRERRRRVLELLEGMEGDVLDVGCGPGVFADELADRGWRFFGVDRAHIMLEVARREFAASGGTRVARADAPALPFPASRFDALVCVGVLDRVADQEGAIGEFVRVVRPGGRIVVSFPNARSPYTLWSSTVYRPGVGWLKTMGNRVRGRPTPPNRDSSTLLHTPVSAAALLHRAGATVTAVEHFHFDLLLSPLDEAFPSVAATLVRRLERLRSTPLAWVGTGFLACATVDR
ncbi:MAG: class I SAM-dependent methyltransferase [Acidimicrobiales bacterium]